jgi:hypothetical protein
MNIDLDVFADIVHKIFIHIFGLTFQCTMQSQKINFAFLIDFTVKLIMLYDFRSNLIFYYILLNNFYFIGGTKQTIDR